MSNQLSAFGHFLDKIEAACDPNNCCPVEDRKAQRAADELQGANEQGIIALRKLRAMLEGDEPEVSLGTAYHDGDFPKAVVELLAAVSVDGSADDILRSLSLTFKSLSECCEAARGNH